MEDMRETILLHSMVKKHFSVDLLFELDRLSMNHDVDNNTKGVAINQMLSAYGVPFKGLGSGTNRYTVLIEDYVFKFALDEDGKTDNKREFIYSKVLQPYVIRVYECMKNGLIAVCEYFEVFSEEDFYNTKNQIKMKKILKELSKNYLIGDIGIYKKNYTNWGYRQSDGEIGILDFAYCYNLTYQVFQCTCADRGILYYDDNYNQLICPFCGKKHTFWDVRKRISRKQEQDEIGDISEKGYTLKKEWETQPLNPKFTEVIEKKKPKKEEKIPEKKKNTSQYDSLSKNQPTGDQAIEMFMEELTSKKEERKETNNGKKEKNEK